jgi:hypothetical protein
MGRLRTNRQAKDELISTSEVLHSTLITMNLTGTRITSTAMVMIITARLLNRNKSVTIPSPRRLKKRSTTNQTLFTLRLRTMSLPHLLAFRPKWALAML